MKRHLLAALAAISIIGISSCTSVRQSWALTDNITTLTPGLSMDKVKNKLGNPHIKNFNVGIEEWGYITEIYGIKMLTILVFADGMLISSNTTPVKSPI